MGVSKYFLVLLLSVNCLCFFDSYQNRPRIKIQNGHMVFVVPKYRNITFQTSSSAGVYINHVDILSTLRKADNVTKITDGYRHTMWAYNVRLMLMEQRLKDGFLGSANSSTASSLQQARITTLTRRIAALNRRFNLLLTRINLNECAENPCKNGGLCIDLFNSYQCLCKDGWEGENCDEDVNECARFQGTDLGCQNGARCNNLPGSYECVCTAGFVGLHCTSRKADCTTSGTELCGHGTCVPQNTVQGYKCICDQGWKSDSSNGACTMDVDECNQNHPACSKNPPVSCVNVPGSFYCAPCPQGFTGNGYHCSDIDECLTNNGGCSQNPMVTCINTHGSRVCGQCPSGYSGDGVTCTYMGVCNVNNGGCHPMASCIGNPAIGSTYVECICPRGYLGDGKGPNGCTYSATAAHPCLSQPCKNRGVCTASATNFDGYDCACPAGYTGRNCEVPAGDPCAQNPCLNGGTCSRSNRAGSEPYQCRCLPGFSGDRCENQLSTCGQTFRQSNGTLKFPSDGFAVWRSNLVCEWVISAPSEDELLNIAFKKFDILNSVGCRDVWLEIYQGNSINSPLLGKYCGQNIPLGGHFQSTSDSVLLKMVSSITTQHINFELSWSTVRSPCGGLIRFPTVGTIRYPEGNQTLSGDCMWNLITGMNKRISFSLFYLQIGNSSDCTGSYIEFSSRSLTSGNQVLRKVCNSTYPKPFTSPGSQMFIHYHAGTTAKHQQFQIVYHTVEGCGRTLTNDTGVIEPPTTIEDNMLCEYKIELPVNSVIDLTFVTPIDENFCDSQRIELREGPDEGSPLVGRYCGSNTPKTYLSNGNQLYIAGTTGPEITRWKLTYERVNGRIFTAPSGTFPVSPVFHEESTNYYQIRQPAGYFILVKFKIPDTNLLKNKCVVKISDDGSKYHSIQGENCDEKSPSVTSSHNNLWIKITLPRVLPKFTRLGTRRLESDVNDEKVIVEYSSINIGCGGIMKNTFGTIASPTHSDGLYRRSITCTWLLMAPKDHVIQLSWNTFNLEHSYECSYDNVMVFDNSTDMGEGQLLGKFCGFNLPPILLSTSNLMTVVFNSDLTVSMDGFLASYIFIHESKVCGGNYFTSFGVLKSPNYPRPYPTSRECAWTINVPPGQQILLNVTDFDVEYFAECRYDVLEIRNGGTSYSPLIGKYCGTKIPKLIPSHTNKLYISFKSDLNRNDRGFRIEWTSAATGCGGTLTSPTGSITSPQYPEPYSRNTECQWKIVTSAGSFIQVIFADIQLEKQYTCVADYVELFDGDSTNSRSLGRYCHDNKQAIKSTGHQMIVKFRSDVAFQGRGFQLHYMTVCRSSVQGFHGVIESPNFPNQYQQDTDCEWDIVVPMQNKINITFSHFDLEMLATWDNKSCGSDYVEVKYEDPSTASEENPTFETYGKYCGNNNPGHLSINSNHVKIHFTSDGLIQGNGFRLEWELFGCGGHIKKKSGTISSPNYPQVYPASVQCDWLIEVDYGFSVEIEFHEVDIEKDSSCQFDHITIYNGVDDTYNQLAKICHQNKKSLISTSGNFMFVRFVSDYSYQGSGFLASFSAVETKCGGTFTTADGWIYTPNYPKNYNANDTCFWLIDIDDNHAINLEFEDFDLLHTINCSENYVKVYDGPNEAYPLLGTFCGNEKPNVTIHSTYNNMFIEFRSKSSVTTKGFSARYRKSCGAILKDTSGIIKIDEFEFRDYHDNCSWTIKSPDLSKHVSLTITHMEGDLYCSDEDPQPVEIYNGESTASPRIDGYCGTKIPPTIVSDGSSLTISINTPLTFFATYSIYDNHCGGSLTSSDGYFASPGYPKNYPVKTQCEWTLKVAPGNTITLNFIDFDLLKSDNCTTDFLEIRKNNATGALLGVYCGDGPPSNITHVGSLWILLKTSDLMEGETAIPSKGFKAEYNLNFDNELSGPRGEIFSPLYPNIFKRYGTFTWKITVQMTRRIMLTFNEFYMDTADVDDTECFYSKMQIYDGPDDTSNLLGLYCGLRKMEPVRSTSNVMFIRVEYGMTRLGTRFRLEWSEVFISFLISPTAPPSINGTSECGRTIVIDKNPYPFHSPGYPNGYKHNMKCDWTFFSKVGTHMRISFSDVNLIQYHGYFQDKCQFGDVVKLHRRKAEDDEWEQFATVCRKKASENWFEATNMMKVEFVTTRFLNGTGFAASVVPVCGGTLSGPTSYILFDNSTVRGRECQWNITARSTRTIQMTVEAINIPHDTTRGCNNYLLIRNGKFADSPLLGDGKYCGNAVPAPVTSTSNNLYVKYLGPSTSTFRIKFQEVKSSFGGTIELTRFDPSTVISSPNYPNVPKSHIEVDWLIIAPPGESLRIDFEGRFDLSRSENCKVEYVEVRDGATERSRLIGRYCSSSPPDSQFTTDNMMFVRFFTDTDDPKNGFKANVTVNRCGGTYRGKEGVIRYTEDKAQRANCTWNLIAPRDHYLKLTFSEFDINRGNCDNHVEISEPFNVSDSHISKYCGPNKPETFTSLGNRVIVKYLAKTNGTFAIKFEANQTACGGSLNQESGIIQSPGYPVMNHRARMCIWTITVPEGRRISLQFLDLDMDVENILENGLVAAEGDRFAIILFNYRINKTSHSIQSSSNKMSIMYLSDSASSHRGFKARFTSDEPTICEGTFSDAKGVLSTPPSKNHTYYCRWSHNQGELDRKHTLAMTVKVVVKSAVKDLTCLRPYHTIAIYNEDKDELARICETTKEPLVILSPFLKTLVLASSRVEMNFSISYDTYECGGILLGERGELKTPNYPLPPTSVVYCSWSIRLPSQQTVNLTSANVRLGEDCQKSYLTVFNGKLPTDPKIGKFCGNQPINVLSQSNYLLLEYKWEPGSSATGLRLKYEAMSSGCGGTFHDRTRIIHSPNYGSEDYPANAECLWEINAEPGYFVKIDFLDRFHIEESVNCQNDFIEIFDWKDDKWVSTGKKCGRTAPTGIYSTSQRMRILFRSNGQISSSGFKAQWVWHCGGTFKASKAEHDIVSPGYPLRYSNGLTCIYNIISEGNINIVFRDFELEDGPTDCRYDNLTIATNDRIRRDMKTSCGKNIPPPMTIYKNAQIIFKTDAYQTAKGFKFSYYDHSCGGNVTEETDIEYNFVSLNGFGPPTLYGRRLCEWKITAPTNKIVVLNIISLYTATPPMCFSQYLDVYDSPKDRLARLCGTIEDRPPIFSTSNSMIVRLNPGWRSFKTFKAAVKFVYGPSSGCGGTLRVTTSTQYIQPPNLEDLHCFWRIWAPRDHQIIVDFAEQNLPSTCVVGNETLTACDCASIEVRDGGSPFSNLLERVCSNQTGSVVRTVAQVAFVSFKLAGKKENAFKISVKAETSVCGENVINATNAIQVLTTPGYPSSYPSVKCLYHFVAPGILDKVLLHFEDFDLTPEEKPRGHEHLTRCRGDKVEIVEDTNDNMMWQGFGNMSSFKGSSSSAYLSFYDEKSKHTFCGKDDKPFDYFSKTNSVSLFVIPRKDAVTKRGRGLKIEYNIAGCNRNYTDLTGRLSNGNGRSDCAISIIVPDNRTISLYFNLFFMFRSANCTDAFFLVRDGSPDGPVLLRTCGYRMPDPVFSFTNRLYIHVKNKDLSRLMVRYDLDYVSTDKGRGCGGEIYGYRGKVFSPLYPNAFKNNTECTWVIKTPVGLHAALKVMRFEIQGGCADNYLSVMTYTLDAEGQPTPLTTKFCSGDNPAILRSESLIRITYKSSVANGGSGWYAVYQGLRAGIKDLH